LAHGGVLLVPLRIQGYDVEFLVDTGSAYTALSRDLVALLSIRIDASRTTAIAPVHGSIVRVPSITLAELSLGGFRVTNSQAVVLELPHQLRLDGLLGMNVLKQFRMTIEIDTRTLVLRPTRSRGA
jgi:clan AA aspartic protease (TIGR02281 family)